MARHREWPIRIGDSAVVLGVVLGVVCSASNYAFRWGGAAERPAEGEHCCGGLPATALHQQRTGPSCIPVRLPQLQLPTVNLDHNRLPQLQLPTVNLDHKNCTRKIPETNNSQVLNCTRLRAVWWNLALFHSGCDSSLCPVSPRGRCALPVGPLAVISVIRFSLGTTVLLCKPPSFYFTMVPKSKCWRFTHAEEKL